MNKVLSILILTLSLASCSGSSVKTIEEVRQVKVGLTEMEILYLLGEPREIEVEVGYEEWYYSYEANSRYNNTINIYIKDGKVFKYTSY